MRRHKAQRLKLAVWRPVAVAACMVSLGSWGQSPAQGQTPNAQTPNGQTPTRQAIAPEIQFIAAGIRSARNELKCAQAHVVFYQHRPKEFEDWFWSGAPRKPIISQDYTDSLSARWYYQAPKLAMIVETPSGNPEEVNLFRLTWNGRYVETLNQIARKGRKTTSSQHIQSSGGIYPPGEYIHDGMWKLFTRVDPRAYITHRGGPITTPLDQYILDKPSHFEGQEKVFGATCFKIRVPSSETDYNLYWFDTEHGFLIRKNEHYQRLNGKDVLNNQWLMPEIIGSNGAWLPAVIEKKDFWGVQANKDVAPIITRVTISNFETSCNIPEEVFQIDWPVDTVINDKFFSGKRIVIAAQEPPQAEKATVEKTREEKTAELPRAEDDPSNVIGVAAPAFKSGQAAPEFTASDMLGKQWKLSELKDKKNLLLTFFPKCFTGGCANHLSSLSDYQTQFNAADTQILAVSVDPAEGEKGQKAFATQWQLTFPMIPDTQRKLSMLYGAAKNDKELAARMSVLIDKSGTVRWIDTNVQIKTHGADVLAKMRELGMAK